MKQRIFLSYASPDSDWVKTFCDQNWFGRLLPDVEIDDYQDMVHFGSIRRRIDEEINSVAALIAFISRDYLVSKYSQVEWKLTREMSAEHKLIVVPIIMDDYAKSWWKEQKTEFGQDFGIGGDDSFAFVDFAHPTDPKHAVPIVGLDGPIQVVTQKISDLARLIKCHLSRMQKSIVPDQISDTLDVVRPLRNRVMSKPADSGALNLAADDMAWCEGQRERGEYDVFLCHNTEDKPAVKKIGGLLIGRRVVPWLDEWDLRPGLPWQEALEVQIGQIKSAAVFVGESGFGPWQNMELAALLREFVARRCPVIPVILSTCENLPQLPAFLRGLTWVDFRKPKPEPVGQLIWGITGKRPPAGN